MQETQETWVQSLSWDDPMEEGMASHSRILAWRIPWTEEPGGLQSIGSQRVRQDWSDCTHMHTHGDKQNSVSVPSGNLSEGVIQMLLNLWTTYRTVHWTPEEAATALPYWWCSCPLLTSISRSVSASSYIKSTAVKQELWEHLSFTWNECFHSNLSLKKISTS